MCSISCLEPPSGLVSMVLDTDTYNEIDDQFALVYALLSPEKIRLEAVYAAPFYFDAPDYHSSSPLDGMEKSHGEILRILELMGQRENIPAFRGAGQYLKDKSVPVESDAVDDLVERAMANRNGSLYVVGIAACTNIASAIIKKPEIVDRIVVVWLGGHPHGWHTAHEFNLMQDVAAAQILFDSGVPLVHIPCKNVAEHLVTTIPELDANLRGKNELCDHLCDSFAAYAKKRESCGWSKEIWDIANIAWLVNPEWTASAVVHSPILTDNITWSFDPNRHFIRELRDIRRNKVFEDLFIKLDQYSKGEIQI